MHAQVYRNTIKRALKKIEVVYKNSTKLTLRK